MACQHKFQPGDIVRWNRNQGAVIQDYGDITMIVTDLYCARDGGKACGRQSIFVQPFGCSTWNNYGGHEDLNFWESRFVLDPFLMAVRKRRHPECQPSPEK